MVHWRCPRRAMPHANVCQAYSLVKNMTHSPEGAKYNNVGQRPTIKNHFQYHFLIISFFGVMFYEIEFIHLFPIRFMTEILLGYFTAVSFIFLNIIIPESGSMDDKFSMDKPRLFICSVM